MMIFPELEAPPARVGRPVARARRNVRHFTCSAADLTQIRAWLGTSPTCDQLRGGVETAVARIVPQTRRAVQALRARPRTAHTRQLFRAVFGVLPEAVPSWRTANSAWRDLGELVALRLERGIQILNGSDTRGGYIRYFARGSSTHCPECTGQPTTYRACSSFQGHYLICLGRPFWVWWRDRNFNAMGSTLLHEALHIYFNRTVAHARRFNNAACYQLFVSRINGITPNHCARERCLGSACV